MPQPVTVRPLRLLFQGAAQPGQASQPAHPQGKDAHRRRDQGSHHYELNNKDKLHIQSIHQKCNAIEPNTSFSNNYLYLAFSF